jgi:hypothetical protein
VAGGTVLVGGQASAWVLAKTGSKWEQGAKLRPKAIQANVDFGLAVGVSGSTVVIGAGNDPSGDGTYVFGAENVSGGSRRSSRHSGAESTSAGSVLCALATAERSAFPDLIAHVHHQANPYDN